MEMTQEADPVPPRWPPHHTAEEAGVPWGRMQGGSPGTPMNRGAGPSEQGLRGRSPTPGYSTVPDVPQEPPWGDPSGAGPLRMRRWRQPGSYAFTATGACLLAAYSNESLVGQYSNAHTLTQKHGKHIPAHSPPRLPGAPFCWQPV
eukprot:jgi/Botrbrau1/10386/Bobra.146_2s0024.1